MNPLASLAILSGIIYCCIIDATFLKIYIIVLLCYTILTQFFAPSEHNYLYRKINMTSWDCLNDSQIHVTFEWNMHKAEEYMEKKKQSTKLPLTWTHFVGFCASRAIHNQLDFNGRLSFGNVCFHNAY